MKTNFIKSPINYVGNKYKLLPQLHTLFPKNIHTFIDLFTGGTDVVINTPAINKYANDINNNIIDIYKAFQDRSIEEIMAYINNRIKEFKLTRYNSDGYIQYRDLYNTNSIYKTPLDLFILTRFSFNNKISFNSNNEYNGSFGYDRSDFNLNQRANTRAMHAAIQNIHFSCKDFRDFKIDQFTNSNDFLYADPPYLISNAFYNDGPKAIHSNWTVQDDLDLFHMLDKANEQGIKWALSNMIAHKGKENVALIEWSEKYKIHDIFSNYSYSAYNKIKTTEPTIEVLITNY